MTTLKRLTLTNRLIGLYTLLTKANGLHLITLLGNHNVALSSVARRAFGLVKALNACPF
jgi:hypothetical protein